MSKLRREKQRARLGLEPLPVQSQNDASEDVIQITVPPNLSKLEREAFYRSLNDHDGDIYIVGKDGKTFLAKK